MQTSIPTRRILRFGPFEVDLRAGELRREGHKLKIQEQPFQILAFLLAHPGEVVTREELREKIWGHDTFIDFDDGLNTSINKLRAALGDSANHPMFIETLPRRGYRLLVPVSGLEHEAAGGPPPAQSSLQKSGPAAEGDGEGNKTGRRRLSAAHSALLHPNIYKILTVTTLLAVAGAGAYLRLTRRSRIAGMEAIHSLAVLPFRNLSEDPTQEYLADGMTEALIGRLSRIHDLRVISHTSVMRFKNPQISVPEIARTLRVDALVEGSVMREGSRIRVTAQLIRAETDDHFWSETYDRELRDALALQSELAQSIAGKVEVTVTGKEHERLAAVHSVSPEVYENYLKGRFAFNRSDSIAGIQDSIAYFEQAIARDPTFAPAYVGLASAYDELGTVFMGAPPEETRPKVLSAARKALELDPGLAEAHALVADVQQEQWQWADAEAEYRRALELNPNDAAAHDEFADWFLCQGRTEEALASAQRARELDPLAVSGASIGWILFNARRYDEAISELRSVQAVRPDDAGALWFLGFALIGNNQPEDAITVLEKVVSLSNRSPGPIGVLIRAYAHAGRRSDALRLLAELKKRRKASYVPAGAFVNAYLGLGEYDQAFVWLEEAYKEHSDILQWLKVHPYFDPLRDDPRFAELVHRVGLG